MPVSPGKDSELKMVESYFAVVIDLDMDGKERYGLFQTGQVTIPGKWRSKTWDLIIRLWAIFWEESTF